VLRILGVNGQHEHEVESPSFYNEAEVLTIACFYCSRVFTFLPWKRAVFYSSSTTMGFVQIAKVVEVCADLLSSGSLSPSNSGPIVTAKDIGVIAAFRQQVLKIRYALRAAGMSNVNVGSVEDFQVSSPRPCLLFV
jgi:hypothetical protein